MDDSKLTIRQQTYKSQIEAFSKSAGSLIKGCRAFVKALSSEELNRLEALHAEIDYHCRRYGSGQFYCWALHPVFKERPIDPWPASRYPKAVLLADLAIRT